jgi:hypothetical protein
MSRKQLFCGLGTLLLVVGMILPGESFQENSRIRAADVFITEMDLLSGISQQGEVSTWGDFTILLDGGYKYHGELMFRYLDTDLESPGSSLGFYGANATVKDMIGTMDFTYFTGYLTTLGLAEHYAGPLYHRIGGFEYRGLLPIHGTGMRAQWEMGERFEVGTLVYQRAGGATLNSADLIVSSVGDRARFDLFSGFTEGLWRVGTHLEYTSDMAKFYVTAGLPEIGGGNPVTLDSLYFLLEQWYTVGAWNQILSLFTRPPVHYNPAVSEYQATGATGDVDIHFDMFLEPADKLYAAGTALTLKLDSSQDTGIVLTPHAEIYTGGILWILRVNFDLGDSGSDLVNGLIGIRAAF